MSVNRIQKGIRTEKRRGTTTQYASLCSAAGDSPLTKRGGKSYLGATPSTLKTCSLTRRLKLPFPHQTATKYIQFTWSHLSNIIRYFYRKVQLAVPPLSHQFVGFSLKARRQKVQASPQCCKTRQVGGTSKTKKCCLKLALRF